MNAVRPLACLVGLLLSFTIGRSAAPPRPDPGHAVHVLVYNGTAATLRYESQRDVLFGRVQAADAVRDGRLVVVRGGGDVAILSRGDDGLFEVDVEMVAQNGIPSEPSALAVLEGDSGLRVLVTTAGSDALFVFDLPAGEPVDLPEPPQDSSSRRSGGRAGSRREPRPASG